LCRLLIILAAIVAYHNSFSGPFVFDDIPAITDNSSIRNLWSIGRVLSPPLTSTGAAGRPVVNLSLAINYALGGTDPVGYHVVNLFLHVMVALVLFSTLLLTLRLRSMRGLFATRECHIALAITLLWTVHPLLTNSITSVIHRSELIVGFFYLATFYCVIRSFTATATILWYGCSIAACLLGMASKEVMVTAPVMVLLFDRAFEAGSVRKALARRWPLYCGLASTWLVLLLLMAGNNGRDNTVGFGHGVEWWQYGLTQCGAIVHYLGLAFWPGALVFDYGTEVVGGFVIVLPQIVLLTALLAATAYATLLHPKLGFSGWWFLGILAPTSSIVPIATQTMSEHRMYLPLISIVAVVVVGLFSRVNKRTGFGAVVLVATILGWRTVRRNRDHASAYSLWSDTISKRPGNGRAYNHLGNALDEMGYASEALGQYEQALRFRPDSAMAWHNRGETMLKMGRVSEAIEEFDRALRINPDYVKALKGKGDALMKAGQGNEAISLYEEALKLEPDDLGAAFNLGSALLVAGRVLESIERLETVVRIDPHDGDAHNNLGSALLQAGQVEPAISHFERALRLEPDSVNVHCNYAKALQQAGRMTDAIGEYRKVIVLRPDHVLAYFSLGNIYARLGQLAQAVAAYETALKYRPEYAEAHNNYGTVLRRLGRIEEARKHYLMALQNRPDYLQARENLDDLLKAKAVGGQDRAVAKPDP